MGFAQRSLEDIKASEVDSGASFNTALQHMQSIESEFFTFESMVRPDHVVVIHLRGLKRTFRNKRMMDYLAQYIRNNIGGFTSFHADFIGKVSNMDKAQEINSLDIFVEGYTPALVHDERFVVRHLTSLGQKLIEHIRMKF